MVGMSEEDLKKLSNMVAAEVIRELGPSLTAEVREGVPRAEVKLRGICADMKKWIIQGRKDIQNKNQHIRYLEGEINKLMSKPNPDMDHIEELRKMAKELEDELEIDIMQQQALEGDYNIHCSSL